MRLYHCDACHKADVLLDDVFIERGDFHCICLNCGRPARPSLPPPGVQEAIAEPAPPTTPDMD
jgi:hypothetical protein